MHTSAFSAGSAPDPAGGAYNAPSDPIAGLRGWERRKRDENGQGREVNGQESGGRGRNNFVSVVEVH